MSLQSGDPDQKLHCVASDLDLHCLPLTPLGVSRLKCFNSNFSVSIVRTDQVYSKGKAIIIIGRFFLFFPCLYITPLMDRHSGSVVERPLCDREVAGSIPGRVIPKTLKMVLAALSLGAQH